MSKLVGLLLLGATLALSMASDTQPASGGGYLFAHMKKEDYGRLYYAISRDALHWTSLNDGKRICAEYRGHPDICRGHDSRYYLTGGSKAIALWVSDGLLEWKKLRDLEPDLEETPGFRPAEKIYGAPKICYDDSTKQYVITWHTSQNRKDPVDTEMYWRGQRTLYITSRDLKTFTEPRKLFQFDRATIDVILHRSGDRWYALLKDELYPSFEWPTGKTIRISSATGLEGPWSSPSPPISPNFREAPTLIPRPDGKGWYLYCEQYPGVQYDLLTAPEIGGPWHGVYIKDTSVPTGARHGCMLPIPRERYAALEKALGGEPAERPGPR